MGSAQGVIAGIDQLITYFNKRRLDLPDNFFDRRAQFIINGTPFEMLLSTTPDDPLVLMLARGPAGYRFTIKALQHAVPNATIERNDVSVDGDRSRATTALRMSGTLRGSGEAIDAVVPITLRLTQAGLVEAAEAVVDEKELQKIRDARLMV